MFISIKGDDFDRSQKHDNSFLLTRNEFAIIFPGKLRFPVFIYGGG